MTNPDEIPTWDVDDFEISPAAFAVAQYQDRIDALAIDVVPIPTEVLDIPKMSRARMISILTKARNAEAIDPEPRTL